MLEYPKKEIPDNLVNSPTTVAEHRGIQTSFWRDIEDSGISFNKTQQVEVFRKPPGVLSRSPHDQDDLSRDYPEKASWRLGESRPFRRLQELMLYPVRLAAGSALRCDSIGLRPVL